jgi:predicted TIM-barrel fold metal-dependent hydrolase
MSVRHVSRRDVLRLSIGLSGAAFAASVRSAACGAPSGYAKPIIDAHTHLRADLIDEIVKIMDACQIEKAVTVSMPIPWLDWATEEGAMALAKHLHPQRIIFFTTVNVREAQKPDFAELEAARIEACVKNGSQGIKMYFSPKGHPFSWFNLGLAINDRRMEPIYKVCGELGVPLLIHLNPDETAIGQFLDAVGRFPKTNFIAAHALGGHGREPVYLARHLQAHRNLFIDTVAVFARPGDQAEIDAARRFFEDFSDRIVYGTDPVMSIFRPGMPQKWRDAKIPQARAVLEGSDRGGLGLRVNVLERVYRQNISALLGQSNPINLDYFRSNLADYVAAVKRRLAAGDGALGGTTARGDKSAMVPSEMEHFLAFVNTHVPGI